MVEAYVAWSPITDKRVKGAFYLMKYRLIISVSWFNVYTREMGLVDHERRMLVQKQMIKEHVWSDLNCTEFH